MIIIFIQLHWNDKPPTVIAKKKKDITKQFKPIIIFSGVIVSSIGKWKKKKKTLKFINAGMEDYRIKYDEPIQF